MACHSKVDVWPRNWRDILAKPKQTPSDDGIHVTAESIIEAQVSHIKYRIYDHLYSLFSQVKDDQSPDCTTPDTRSHKSWLG